MIIFILHREILLNIPALNTMKLCHHYLDSQEYEVTIDFEECDGNNNVIFHLSFSSNVNSESSGSLHPITISKKRLIDYMENLHGKLDPHADYCVLHKDNDSVILFGTRRVQINYYTLKPRIHFSEPLIQCVFLPEQFYTAFEKAYARIAAHRDQGQAPGPLV